MTPINLADYRKKSKNNAANSLRQHRKRVLGLMKLLVPKLGVYDDGDWEARGEKADKEIDDFFRICGLNSKLAHTAEDFLQIWNNFHIHYSVVLTTFLTDRPRFDNTLKSRIPELVAYFEAIANADFQQARGIADKHRITECMLKNDPAPLVYDAWAKDGPTSDECLARISEKLKESKVSSLGFLATRAFQVIKDSKIPRKTYSVDEALRRLRGDFPLQGEATKALRMLGLQYIPGDEMLMFDISDTSKLNSLFRKSEFSENWRNALQPKVGYHLDLGLLTLEEWLEITSIYPGPALSALGHLSDWSGAE